MRRSRVELAARPRLCDRCVPLAGDPSGPRSGCRDQSPDLTGREDPASSSSP